MFEITFLRHGQSVGNRDGYHQGQHDYPLTPTGEAQARALARYWLKHNITFDQIITSPLVRACHTAEIIGEALGLAPISEPLWTERHNGVLQGLSNAEAHRLHPRPDFIDLYTPIGKTGESQWQLYLRAGKALQQLLGNEPGRYLIVSHGGLFNVLMHAITGIVPQADFRGTRFPIENTAYTLANYDPQHHTWFIIAHNICAHLDSPTFQNAYKFTLMRHGQSEGNRRAVFQGQVDYPLSEQGHQEVTLLAQHWLATGMRFDGIITSPLARARQTAAAIADALGLKIELDENWKEINNGEMAGLTRDEIAARFPNRDDQSSIHAPLGNSGESWWELYLRAGNVIDNLLHRPPGHYLVVSHGTFLNYVMRAIIGTPGTHTKIGHPTPWFHFGNTGYAQVTYEPHNHTWHIERIGESNHLQALPS